MTSTRYPRVLPVTESAVLVEFGSSIDYGINAKVYALNDLLESSELAEALVETIPTFRSILIEYDASQATSEAIQDAVEVLLGKLDTQPIEADGGAMRVHDLPVAYGGDFGPDLGVVADHTGLSEDEVIRIHSGTEYRVFMLGFAPGFPYLGGMDERIACPRLATPRIRVDAGSVGIAENQTGIYPNASPGGWQIIGRSPSVLFDVDADPPSALLPGAGVRFVPITHEEFERLAS